MWEMIMSSVEWKDLVVNGIPETVRLGWYLYFTELFSALKD